MKYKPVEERKPIQILDETVPILLNMQDAAQYTGYSKQRIRANLQRQYDGTNVKKPFPKPFIYLSNGPLWTKKQIDTFLSKK